MLFIIHFAGRINNEDSKTNFYGSKYFHTLVRIGTILLNGT